VIWLDDGIIYAVIRMEYILVLVEGVIVNIVVQAVIEIVVVVNVMIYATTITVFSVLNVIIDVLVGWHVESIARFIGG
jgi:hypothetical protein